MMTYDEAVSFIKEISKSGSILGLENIENLMNELGNVENELNIIHIAGTNGKGSVGAYLFLWNVDLVLQDTVLLRFLPLLKL